MADIPFMKHCGIVRRDAPAGTARFSVTVAPHLANSRGVAHGGLLLTMLDIALGHAAADAVEGAVSFITIDLQSAFLSPATGEIIAEGRAVRAGRSIVFCEGDIRDSTGTLLVRASGVFKPVFPK